MTLRCDECGKEIPPMTTKELLKFKCPECGFDGRKG